MPSTVPRPVLCALAASVLSLGVVAAQQGAVSFKHFHTYPYGQWQQQGQAYRNGKPFGQPIVNTTCSAPLSPAGAAAVKSFGNSAASECTIHVLADTESTADYEQVCNMPGGTQVNHMTMHAVDDKTVATEIHVILNGHEVSESRLTNRYQGTCQPGSVGNMPQMPKPSAEDCKQIAEMKQQASESAKSCTAAPAAERAGCEAVMQRMTKQVEQLSASCR